MNLARIFLVLIATATLSACVTNRTFGEGVDDSGINLTMKRYLLADRQHKFGDVDITVFEQRIMLTGSVRTEAARAALTSHARRIASVDEQDILNETIVAQRTPFAQGTRDARIHDRFRSALIADNGIYNANYRYAVSNSTVYILGVAQGPNELERVVGHAKTINGVTNIVSNVLFVGDPRRQT